MLGSHLINACRVEGCNAQPYRKAALRNIILKFLSILQDILVFCWNML